MAGEHPHARIAKQLWSAVADGDAAALAQILAPDVSWHSVGHNRVSGDYHGPAEVMEYLATIGDLTTDLVSTLDGIYVGSEGAIVLHHVSAERGAKKLEMDYMIQLTIHNEHIAEALSVPVDQRTNDAFWN